MADLSINVNLGNLTDAERAQLMKLVEKSTKPKEKYEHGQWVWYINSDGTINRCPWSGSEWQRWYDSIGALYLTENDAIEDRKRKIFQAEWKRLAEESGEANNPWDDQHPHYFAYYALNPNEVRVCFNQNTHQEETYFASEQAVKSAIRTLGVDNVKEYILGVKE